ncbi:MAG: DUF4276 family protein [Cyanobacterium sp. T60_A2020_053]|nr:DUF4276 family protein [Cyanobacterium sp. T60_A2020_053]
MHLEFLVEEASLAVTLEYILPKILANFITFKIHDFRGKQELLRKLPDRLRGYKPWLPNDWKIVVLIDEDRQDCKILKQQLEDIAMEAGFFTKTNRKIDQDFQVLNRIVIEELESWFFGDINAICQAYPKISRYLNQKKSFREPDKMEGGTWEALERVLKQAGYHQGGLEKFKAAKAISPYLNPLVNKSNSFQVFYLSLLEMTKVSSNLG